MERYLWRPVWFRRGDRALIAGFEGTRVRIESLDGRSPAAVGDSKQKCH